MQHLCQRHRPLNNCLLPTEEKGGFLTMNATRASTTIATDGAVFGTIAETPPEDPPPER